MERALFRDPIGSDPGQNMGSSDFEIVYKTWFQNLLRGSDFEKGKIMKFLVRLRLMFR